MKDLEKNINEDSTDNYQLTKDKTSDIVGFIDAMILISKSLAFDFRSLNKKGVNIHNNEDIQNALTDWCTHKDVMYIAGMIEGSKISPLSDENIENRKYIKKIINDYKEKLPSGIDGRFKH